MKGFGLKQLNKTFVNLKVEKISLPCVHNLLLLNIIAKPDVINEKYCTIKNTKVF